MVYIGTGVLIGKVGVILFTLGVMFFQSFRDLFSEVTKSNIYDELLQQIKNEFDNITSLADGLAITVMGTLFIAIHMIVSVIIFTILMVCYPIIIPVMVIGYILYKIQTR